MVAMNIAAPPIPYVPPASPFDAPARPSGRLPSSPEVVERRRANRRSAAKARAAGQVHNDWQVPGPDDVAKPKVAAKPLVPDRLSHEGEELLRRELLPLLCSDAWVGQIIELLRLRRKDGRPLVPYKARFAPAVDDGGNPIAVMDTKTPALLRMVATAMVKGADGRLVRHPLAYPPVADDAPLCRMVGRAYHRGSTLRPCWCKDCSRVDADGGHRAVLWPAHYVATGSERRGGGRPVSHTCSVNRAALDADAASTDPDLAELAGGGEQMVTLRPAGGRYVGPKDVAGAMHFDPDGWRHDKVRCLALESRSAAAALRAHAWTSVEGDWDREGRSTVRRVRHRLGTVGEVVDFLDLGRILGEVAGLTPTSAAEVRRKVEAYPRVGRWVRAKLRER